MSNQIHSDPTAFSEFESLVEPFEAVGRTRLWPFQYGSETIYRLDEVEAQDAVCDRKMDIGTMVLMFVTTQKTKLFYFNVKKEGKSAGGLRGTKI